MTDHVVGVGPVQIADRGSDVFGIRVVGAIPLRGLWIALPQFGRLPSLHPATTAVISWSQLSLTEKIITNWLLRTIWRSWNFLLDT